MKPRLTLLTAALLTLLPALPQPAAAASAGTEAATESAEKHDARMAWWRDARFGMFVHWGLYSGLAGNWDGKPFPKKGGMEWIQHYTKADTDTYASKALPLFKPKPGFAVEWMKLAKQAGCKYVVFTTKHHEGFGLHASKAGDYNAGAKLNRDLVKEITDAARAEGLKIGFYHSVIDWHHDQYAYAEAKGLPHPLGGKPYANGKRDHKKYISYLHAQVKELLGNYGKVDILWWDFSSKQFQGDEAWGATELVKMARSLQPDIVMNNRLYSAHTVNADAGESTSHSLAKGDFTTPEQRIPDTGMPGVDWETCMTLNGTWGYSEHDHNWKSGTTLIRNLVDIASKGGNYLLNIGPKGDGSLDPETIKAFTAIGDWMKVNGEAIHGTRASPFAALPWGRATSKGDALYLHVFDWPKDGVLTVPPGASVKRATLLASPDTKLAVEMADGGLKITLPAKAPDENVSVIKLELAGPLPAAATGDKAAEEQAKALGQADRNAPKSRNTHPDAQWFPDAGLGLFIHWGLASPRASGDLSWGMLANKPWKDKTITPNDYYSTVKNWDPSKMDYDKILGAAKAAGATYAVMVTKHHDGFTFWPSAFGDIGTKQSFGGRDFVKEFTDACRKHGLKVGLYYSPPDWWFDRQYKSFSMGKQILDMDHKPVKLPARPKDHDAKRAELVRGQVTELLTKYGKVDLIWFDGGRGEIPNTEVRRLQPGIVINKRNGGNGDYGDSEVGLPSQRFSGWFETCATCWPSKKWAYTEEYGFDDAPMALTKLVLLRAWGGNLLANLGPMGDGSAPEQAYACWSDMAMWMAHSRESVIGAKAGPWPGPVNLPVTTREGAAYIHFLPDLPEIYPNTPPDEKKFTKTRSVMPSLPPATDTAVWRDAPKPAKVILLRTGREIPHTYDNGTLTITLPDNLRTGSVDVVKVLWAEPAP